MNNNYDRILKQLKSKRNNFKFTEEDLNKLTEEERNKIEEIIIRLCKYGIESAYEYIPILKNQYVEKLLQDNEIDNLLPESKNLISIYMYIRTKRIEYLEKLDEENINIKQLTVLLNYYNLNKENQELILKINNIINSNKKYKTIAKILTNTYKNEDF